MTESHPEHQPTDTDPAAETRADEVSEDLADDRDVPAPKGDRPQQDAVDAAVQAENAGSSLDQPSQ